MWVLNLGPATHDTGTLPMSYYLSCSINQPILAMEACSKQVDPQLKAVVFLEPEHQPIIQHS